jgi:hypothetical protein
MGLPPQGFRLIWDATSLDGTWVLLPGCLALALAAVLLALRRAAGGRRSSHPLPLGVAAVLLALGAVWWTLGGLGAWRAGVGRLGSGTADFVEGTVSAPVRGAEGRLGRFQVAGLHFRRAPDALLPALHASRWPALTLEEGTPVRLWFFGDDLLRVEAGERR